MFIPILIARLILWSSIELRPNNVEAAWGKRRDPEIPDPPTSSDVQQLAEALYFDRPILLENAFPRNKQKVDVCKLSVEKAMEVCQKIEKIFKYRGTYSLIPDREADECKLYEIKLHHTLKKPAYEKVEVRKCPFQPKGLFMASGTNRVPVFILTWSGDEEKYLHVDYYVDA